MAIFQNNASGAWYNAKKSFEAGVEVNGEMIYKGSDVHKNVATRGIGGEVLFSTIQNNFKVYY